jgi:16S rRNA (adenine1518-N6/adenine1519-N6)-dimethyltransferase
MVQREVAQGMAAPPGRMGLLSVAIQFYGTPTIVGYVQPESFWPPPKVTSAIVRIDVHAKPPLSVADTKRFFSVVRAGFSAPRKQLRNALSHSLQIPHVEVTALLNLAGIDPRRRAETLSLSEWAQIHTIIQTKQDKMGTPPSVVTEQGTTSHITIP